MRTIVAVMKNNVRRLLGRKSQMILFLFLTAGALAGAVFMNSRTDTIARVAVVGQHPDVQVSECVSCVQLGEAPPLSDLVSGRYDAIVIYEEAGGYEILTLKSESFRQTLQRIIDNPQADVNDLLDNRSDGANILGFLTMFVLMQGSSLMFMLAEDIEKKQIGRIACSPVSFTGYLFAQGFFAFIVLLVPVMVMLTATRYLFRVDIGLPLSSYLPLLALLCALSSTYSLFLTCFIKKSDSASMVASASVVLTSVLAGSFYPFDKGNRILEAIIRLLPQKAFFTMAELVEGGEGLVAWLPHGLYLVILITLFYIASVWKTTRDYVALR